jgi:hypothetical protein
MYFYFYFYFYFLPLSTEYQFFQEEEFLQQQTKFADVVRDLHHLKGTKSIPGVFNPPFVQEMQPTAFNRTIDDHLDEAVRRKIEEEKQEKKTKRFKGTSCASFTMSSTSGSQRGTKAKGPFLPPEVVDAKRNSAVRSNPYQSHVEEERIAKKVDQMMWTASKDFVVKTKIGHQKTWEGIAVGDPYRHKPFEMRTEDKSKRVVCEPFRSGKSFTTTFDGEFHADPSAPMRR